MDSAKKAHLKEEAVREGRMLLAIWIYLATFFAVFLTYRRLLLREEGVAVFHYGFAVIEALIIAKVILLGKAMKLGERATHRTLAFKVLRSSLVYGALVVVFAVLEHVIKGLIHGLSFVASFQEFTDQNIYLMLAKGLILFVALVPFFAFWELSFVMKERNLFELFFKKDGSGPQA